MSDSRTRIWFSLFVLAVFCLGLAAGVVLGRSMPPPRGGPGGAPGMRGRGPGGPPPGLLIDRLEKDLQLTADQKARVETIFKERRGRLESVQREVVARAEQEQRDLQAAIREVLTPDQRQRFDRWLADQPRGRRGRGGFGIPR